MAPIALFRSSPTAGLLPKLRQLVHRFSSRTSAFKDMGFTEDDDAVYLRLDNNVGDKRVRVALSPWEMLSVAEESEELAWFAIWLPALGVKAEELHVPGFKAVGKDGAVHVTLPKVKKDGQQAATAGKVEGEDQSGIIHVSVK